jgi:GNAT superfamily N-acetyltransferase
VADQTELNRIRFHQVDVDRWPDFERLFESRGGPKACWCMVWRATPAEAKRTDGAGRKSAIEQRVSAGIPVGILGYLGTEPVAWCSVAPRSTYRRLVDDDGPHEGVWSIACFFVVRRLRGQGITKNLIAAAVEHARAKGASIVEAYPVDADSPSYRFMGFVPSFAAAGFREVGRAGTRRHVMRLTVRREP